MDAMKLWFNKSNSMANLILDEVSEYINISYPIPIKKVVELFVPDTTIKGTTDVEITSRISALATRDIKDGWYILINKNEPIQRQRFSLAHELGHMTVITNSSSTVYCGKSDSWEEKVCNSFAGKILVPDKMLLQYCESSPNPLVEDVCDAFYVTKAVVEIRMKELGLPFRYFKPF